MIGEAIQRAQEILECDAPYCAGIGQTGFGCRNRVKNEGEFCWIHRADCPGRRRPDAYCGPRDEYHYARLEHAVRLRGEGLSLREIGERFGVSKERIRVMLLQAQRYEKAAIRRGERP